MKTIYFGQPDNPEIKDLQAKGVEVLVAEDPIKYLKAMKNAKDKENYTVLADEQSTKYLEFSKKLGYNEYREFEENPPEVNEDIEVMPSNMISVINEGVRAKLNKEKKRLEQEYKAKKSDEDKRIREVELGYQKKLKDKEKEYQMKVQELERERDQLKKIKQAIKKEVYGTE